jgi:predicted permease
MSGSNRLAGASVAAASWKLNLNLRIRAINVPNINQAQDRRHRDGTGHPHGGHVRSVDGDGEQSRPPLGRTQQQIYSGLRSFGARQYSIAVAIVGFYVLVFVLFNFVFRFSLSESVLAALAASSPAVPFMGPAILGDLFGKSSAVTIAIASLVINLIVVPVTILGLALGRTPVAITGSATTRHSAFTEKLLETVKQPIVWAPVLAFVLVLCNVRVPSIVDHGLSLLGQATSGVALFASGIMLASYKIQIDRTALTLALLKNIVQPALVLVGLRSLGYGAPIVPQGGADNGNSIYADRDRACRPIPCVGRGRLLCPISQRDWLDVHNRGFHRPDTMSDSAEGDLP